MMARSWTELLMDDHQMTEKVFAAMENAFSVPGGPPPEMVNDVLEYLTGYVERCHNVKEERHLFPLLEQRGLPREDGPLAVMLYEHEQARELLARLRLCGERYAGGDRSALGELTETFRAYASVLAEHFWKENDILYPMAVRMFSAQEAASVVAGIEAVEAEIGPETRRRYHALATRLADRGRVEDLSHGLDRPVLAAILNTLPIELSFVDADDTVRYFSHENGDKIFPRSRSAIGMKVQGCHPKASVHRVDQILAEFKAGKRDVAEFWIDFVGRKVHIRYFAVRDAAGQYLGCLETVQDISAIQKLQGQRRLLDAA